MPTELSRDDLTAESIQKWLIERFAGALNVTPDQISADDAVVSFGLDSMVTVEITGDLEKALGRRLPPTLVWDYPTIAAMAEHLGGGA